MVDIKQMCRIWEKKIDNKSADKSTRQFIHFIFKSHQIRMCEIHVVIDLYSSHLLAVSL